MKKYIIIAVSLLFGVMAQAQNSTPVISEIQVYDLGNGSGFIEVRISGANAALINSVPVSISGAAISGGSASISASVGKVITTSNNATKILRGYFSVDQTATSKNVTVQSNYYRRNRRRAKHMRTWQ